MYIFQELKPKVFYFTYCLQEIGNYIKFLEESKRDKYISSWEIKDFGYEKTFSSNFMPEDRPIDPKTLFLVNNLKATFHYCFGQYKLFNNIEEEINLSTSYHVRKYNEGNAVSTDPVGKYTARLYINNSFSQGSIKIPGASDINAESGSIIIAPSDLNITAEPAQNNSRYIGYGYWI